MKQIIGCLSFNYFWKLSLKFYSRKNLKIDLNNPFTTNYFDEDKLLNNTTSFFDELNSISVFAEKKTIIVDIRQCEKKEMYLKYLISKFEKLISGKL